jgi:hypothetical protein
MSAGVRGMGAESRVTLAELEPQPVLPVPSHVRSEVLVSGNDLCANPSDRR